MNITDKIANDLGEYYGNIVRENREIQFYYIDGGYYWRDGRFKKTASMSNKHYTDDSEFTTAMCKHIDESLKYKKEAIADCEVTLTTTCPYCKGGIDLLDVDSGYNQDGENYKIAYGDWSDVNVDITCHLCEETFVVSGVQN